MKQQSEQADCCFDDCIPYERTAQSLTVATDEERTDRHAAEENREDEDLGVGAVADEECEVARPDRFVDEARCAGEKEQRIESEQHQWSVLGVDQACGSLVAKSAHVGSVIAIR